MKNKRFLLLFFVITNTASLVARQGTGAYSQENVNAVGRASGIFQSVDNRGLEIKGSPMLLSYYFPGYLIDQNNKIRRIDSLNLDVYREEVVSKKDRKYIALDKSRIKAFGIILSNEDTVQFIIEGYPKKETVYEILLDGKIAVYKKDIKTLASYGKTGAYSHGIPSFSEFQQTTSFYLKMSNGKIIAIRSKKDIINTFPAFVDQIGAFFKQQKPSVKNDYDLITIGRFLNSL